MQTHRLNVTFALGLLIALGLACNFSASTANISGLKLSKDKEAAAETSSFASRDTVYAVATVSNVPDKVKVKGRLVIEDVAGQQAGPVPGLENTLELAGDGTATFTFTPPESGWPKGKYKVEVLMMNEGGEQKDQKSAGFTVS
ncbi:MAG TPA: hypothetical protein VKB12_16685 [Pyrinomonadaceae bacterium]|nr:hypothetical protein [Pyrinomonadaceae bacterium]